MSYYLHTPTDEEVRGAITRFDLAWTDGGAAFDRWLAARDAAALSAAAPAIQAAALRDAAVDLCSEKCDDNYAPDYCETCRAVEALHARADQLEDVTP